MTAVAEQAQIGPRGGYDFKVSGIRVHVSERFLTRAEQRVYDATKINFVPNAKDEIIWSLTEGYVPIVYTSHKSHYDGRPGGKTTRIIRELANPHLPEEQRYKGFVLPVAASIISGHQGEKVKKVFEDFIVRAQQDNITAIPYVRKKDVELYGMKENKMAFARALKKSIDNNLGILVFPEASVEGGRLDENGQTIGLQPFESGIIKGIAEFVTSQGKEPVLIPAGMSRTNRVFTPGRTPDEYKIPTSTVIKSAIPLLPHGIVKVIVGNPVLLEEIPQELRDQGDDAGLNHFLGEKLSHLLPEDERGIYRQTHQRRVIR